MELHGLHKPGELIDIRWPGGPHDFQIEFEYAEELKVEGWEDWIVLHGLVVKPASTQFRTSRAFYAKPVGERTYEVLPKRG